MYIINNFHSIYFLLFKFKSTTVSTIYYEIIFFISRSSLPCMPYFFCGLYYSSVETVFAAAAASLNFLHSLRCPPCFQWFTWQSRPQYCTVRHSLQGCKGRNGVLGLPQVEQQSMVGVVRPSCLSNFWRRWRACSWSCTAALIHHARASSFDWSTPLPLTYIRPKLDCALACPSLAACV